MNARVVRSATAAEVEALCWAVRRAFRDLALVADRELAPLRIGAADRALLEFLVRAGAPVSISALARSMSVSRQHIHQTLRRLPDPRWIAQSPDPEDARSVLLRLTREGRAVWRGIRRRDEALLARIADGLVQDEVVAATGLLHELRRRTAEIGRDEDGAAS